MSSRKKKDRLKRSKLAEGRRQAPAVPTTDRRLASVIVLALVLMTLAVYWQGLGNQFVNYDDNEYVIENPHVEGGPTAGNLRWAFNIGYAANWHPLTWMSHMLDCQVHGLKPMGHHLTSILFHAANVVLLFLLLVAMTGSVWRSGFVAALFAVHPLHVESVAWVAERKDVLSTFFWLLTMLAYVGYSRRPGFRRYALVLLAFALGLMAKPMLVSLPLVLLMLDYWPMGRLQVVGYRLQGLSRLIIEKLPLFALSAASCVVTFIAQKKAVVALDTHPLGVRAANAVVAYAEYLVKMVWPSGLAVHYPFVGDLAAWRVVCAVLALVGASVLALRIGSKAPDRRYLAAGWLWYLVTLVPVIGLVQVGGQSMADRYTYIPLIGIFIVIAWGVPDLAARLSRASMAIPALGVSAAVVVLALSACSSRQAGYWKDSLTLWDHAIRVTQNNASAQNHMGLALDKEGRLDEAVVHYSEALRIKPDFAEGHYNLGLALGKQGRLDEAAAQYSEALRIKPDYALAHNNLGLTLASQGRLDEAVAQYYEALRIEPDCAEAHCNLGMAFGTRGKLREAIGQFSEALRINPNCVEAHNNLGVALSSQGEMDEAVAQYSEALRIKPDHADAHKNLARALYFRGDYIGAWDHVHLAQKYGAHPDPGLLQALAQEMPEPPQR
jgi:tetratricopeptide (TPR) repeat protein